MSDIKRFMSRLRHGAIKKSLVAGLVTSLSILAVFSAISWYCGLKEMWLTILIFFSTFTISSVDRANSDNSLTDKDKELIDGYYDAISR